MPGALYTPGGRGADDRRASIASGLSVARAPLPARAKGGDEIARKITLERMKEDTEEGEGREGCVWGGRCRRRGRRRRREHLWSLK
jgi:hypothetical protein